MKFIDGYTEHEYSLQDMYSDWIEFRAEDPWNHCIDFRTEMYEILMATINGRNDLEIVGLTMKELCNYIRRLNARLNPSEQEGECT